MTMFVETHVYRMVHLKSPRGKGVWAFFPTSEMKMEEVFFSTFCNFTEAKNQAEEYAKTSPIFAWRRTMTLFVGS